MEFKHIPVLYHEIMEIMAPQPGEVFVDCTLGGGGHSKGFLERRCFCQTLMDGLDLGQYFFFILYMPFIYM